MHDEHQHHHVGSSVWFEYKLYDSIPPGSIIDILETDITYSPNPEKKTIIYSFSLSCRICSTFDSREFRKK